MSSLYLEAPTLQSLVDDAAAQLPELARFIAEALHDELRSSPQFLALQASWRPLRSTFADDLQKAVLSLLALARDGRDPLQPEGPPSGLVLEPLRLIDEQQAQRDVALARIVQATEALAGNEILQLGNCFAALRGTARARSADNPLRPAVFAQGLLNMLRPLKLDDGLRQHLLHAAAQPMAKGLGRLYADMCRRLQDAGLANLLVRHASERTRPSLDHQRLFEARRGDRRSSQMGLLQASEPAAQPDLLRKLYRRILSDPRLQPAIKNLVAQLEPTVARLAELEPHMLGEPEHPAWQLLNRLAANGMAFEHANAPALREFVQHMAQELGPLMATQRPLRGQFEQALQRLEQYVVKTARQRDQRSAAVLAALEREEQRASWMGVIREQLQEQIARASVGRKTRSFLTRSWAEVIVQAMVQHGQDAPEAQARIELVDALLDSLQPLETAAERDALRARLPGLIERLRRGISTIDLSDEQFEPVLQELMEQHGRVLRGAPTAQHAPAAAAPGRASIMDETPSQMPSRWADTKVDRSVLPTVPVQLYSEPDSPEARAATRRWIEDQRVGTWYHLFVQGDWLTAQLTWISESRHYFHFVGQDADVRHSLTDGALEQLLPAGLIAVLGEDGIVERAVDSLMQNLGDAKG